MYKQLTSEQRSQIFALLQRKTPRKEIARIVGISESPLSRELKRNSTSSGKYIWFKAHDNAMTRRKRTVRNARLAPELVWRVQQLILEEEWSPRQISGVLKKEGITEEQFVNYTNYVRKELPNTPRAQIARLRNAVPSPTAETVMQKVIPASDLEMYISGRYDKIQGFITKAADTKHFNSFDDLYYGLRLDYDGTKFFLDEGACYAIRFKSKEVPLKINVPRGRDFKVPYPFTSHGFTAGIRGRIGVPEFTITRGLGVPIEEGTEIWKITRDGKQTLYAVFEEGKFTVLK